jgi:hypothetical protein
MQVVTATTHGDDTRTSMHEMQGCLEASAAQQRRLVAALSQAQSQVPHA